MFGAARQVLAPSRPDRSKTIRTGCNPYGNLGERDWKSGVFGTILILQASCGPDSRMGYSLFENVLAPSRPDRSKTIRTGCNPYGNLDGRHWKCGVFGTILILQASCGPDSRMGYSLCGQVLAPSRPGRSKTFRTGCNPYGNLDRATRNE